MHTRSCTFLLTLTLAACGQAPQASTPQIIGGQAVTAPPFFVSLHSEGESTPFCGGALIATNVVLTAAHCAIAPSRPIEVWLAPSDLKALPESIAVEAVEVYPRYDSRSVQHDLALLHLASHPPSKAFKSIPLATEETKPSSLRVYGFGSISRDQPVYPEHIRAVSVDPIPSATCQSLGGPYGSVLEDQICAGDFDSGERDSCYGDSGGPLMAEGKTPRLYGLVSWGAGCGMRESPGVYTRVSAYSQWISDHKTGLDQRKLTDFFGSVFYFPLPVLSPANGTLRTFSAVNGLWKEGKADEGLIVHTWKRRFQRSPIALDVIALTPNRYKLRVTYKKKVYETSAPFSET